MKEFKSSDFCPHCGGRLIASNIVFATNPPTYSATCEDCGKTFESHSPIGFVDNGFSKDNNMWETGK